MLKIGFLGDNLPISGGNVCIYDYALGNKNILHNQSIILAAKDKIHPLVYEKLRKDIDILLYSSQEELETWIKDLHLDAIYQLSADGNYIPYYGIKTLIHYVFQCSPIKNQLLLGGHSNEIRSTAVSKWLAQRDGFDIYVPHIVWLPPTTENLRKELGIPEDAIVFGRYGSYDTFDIDWVKQALIELKNEHNIWFLFMNTKQFWIGAQSYRPDNFIFLPASTDLYEKRKFINTCDAMLHARSRGETFGLAPMEFSFCNKPVYSWFGSPERAHIDQLGDKGVYYSNAEELKALIYAHKKEYNQRDWNCTLEFAPEKVMKKFEEVFLS